MKQSTGHNALDTWLGLNEVLQSSDEPQCRKLIEIERKHRNRPTFIRRIYARLNKVRADRERDELEKSL